ncbi:MAG: DNA polymerase III subunit gamma/tau [Acidimicrobiia bacterium]
MAPYQSLYRKHRPQTFAALRGQDHVTAALRNAVRDGRVGHAYLFSGPRGTGKTTTARVLAKALNCIALRPEGEPCGECENCVSIAEGRFLDLFELDAASNNSVDNIRDLTESVNLGLGPASSRKVYLVDEVHMLSAAASNALLKTLEEPPDHVVFVLATTNPEKVLPTIRSRTQHFELTLFTINEIVAELTDIIGREGIDADPDAVAVIARAAAGSMRDALSLLDQALAHGTGRLDAEPVADLFGRTSFEVRCRILEAVASEDAALVLTTLGELLDAGHEPRRIAEDLLRSGRDAFLINASAGKVPVALPADEQQRLGDLGRNLGNPQLVRVLETIGQAVVDMRGTDAADPRLVLEVALVRLSRREAGPPLQTVIERIERLERIVADLKEGGVAAAAPASATPGAPGRTIGAIRRETAASAPEPEAATKPEPPVPDPEPSPEAPSAPLELDDVIVAWASILPELPVATRSAVQEAQPLKVEDDIITFGVPPRLFEAASPRFRREADTIRAALSERLGRRARFTLVSHEGFASPAVPPPPTPVASTEPDEPPPPPPPSAPDQPSAVVDLTQEETAIDPQELVDAAPDDGARDSMQMLTENLGATVVEERPRD